MERFSPRQKEIIFSALNIIHEQGIQYLTIKAISGLLGITDGAIYRHFKSKDEILQGVVLYFRHVIAEELITPLLHCDDPGRKPLYEYFMKTLTILSEEPSLIVILCSHEIFKNYSHLFSEINTILETVRNALINAVESCKEKKRVAESIPPTHIYYIINGTTRLIFREWRRKNFSFDILKEGEALWATIEKSITPQ